MTKIDVLEEAKKLPPEERLEVAAELWETGGVRTSSAPDWHTALVKEAVAEYEKNPQNVVSGDEVLARLSRPRG